MKIQQNAHVARIYLSIKFNSVVIASDLKKLSFSVYVFSILRIFFDIDIPLIYLFFFKCIKLFANKYTLIAYRLRLTKYKIKISILIFGWNFSVAQIQINTLINLTKRLSAA